MSDIYRDSIFWVEVERIKPNPFQPRREFDQEKLNGLAESIRMYGLLQPLTVTRKEIIQEDGGMYVEYEIIAGERRLRASKIAGLSQVPVIIRSGEDTDQMKLELAIIENLQREDLNPVDRAKAFLRLHKDFSFTHIEIGRKMGKSREYVSNTLRILALPEAILGYLAEGRISEGHARPLLMLNDRPEEQTVLAREILLKRLTVRESEALARRSAQDRVSAKHKINPEILSLERKLTERLGTRVEIEQREVGGKLVISFFSADDLTALLNAMRLESDEFSVSGTFNGNPVAPAEDLGEKNMIPQEDVPLSIVDTIATEEIQDIPESLENSTESLQDTTETVQDSTLESVPTVKQETVPEVRGFMDILRGVVSEPQQAVENVSSTPETVSSDVSNPTVLTNTVSVEQAPPVVVASTDRPMPEPIIPSRANIDLPPPKNRISIHEPFVPKPAPVVVEKVEDDTELYSIRNFSI